MLSLLIQAWAAQSEEQREGRLAQMRDNNAEVNVEIKYVNDDGDGDQLVINPTFFASRLARDRNRHAEVGDNLLMLMMMFMECCHC